MAVKKLKLDIYIHCIMAVKKLQLDILVKILYSTGDGISDFSLFSLPFSVDSFIYHKYQRLLNFPSSTLIADGTAD